MGENLWSIYTPGSNSALSLIGRRLQGTHGIQQGRNFDGKQVTFMAGKQGLEKGRKLHTQTTSHRKPDLERSTPLPIGGKEALSSRPPTCLGPLFLIFKEVAVELRLIYGGLRLCQDSKNWPFRSRWHALCFVILDQWKPRRFPKAQGKIKTFKLHWNPWTFWWMLPFVLQRFVTFTFN